jgi:hypothetical protein
MDMGKYCVVVFSSDTDCPPDKMTPEMMHALVRARETHIKYRSYVWTVFVQLAVTSVLAFTSSSPRHLVLSVLGASLVNAGLCGLVARSWRRQFERLSRG